MSLNTRFRILQIVIAVDLAVLAVALLWLWAVAP